MLMVIMGAGASHDSAPSMKISSATANGFRLPLANNLFDGRHQFRQALKLYRQIQPIVPYLRDRGTRSLEEVLQELYDGAANHTDRPKQIVALRFYIRDVIYECSMNWLDEIDGVTNHKTLVDQILEFPGGPTLFVTFNYDELIEDALLDRGFRTKYFEDYVYRLPEFRLYKLHGSMRWARLVTPSPTAMELDELIDTAAQSRPPNEGFRMYDNVHATTIDGWAAIPSIALPVFNKSDFECPRIHLENVIQHLPRVDKILAIGWRAKEAHFMKLLTEHLHHMRALWVVSKDDARAILQDLQNQLSSKLVGTDISLQVFESGFTNFVTSRAGRALFNM